MCYSILLFGESARQLPQALVSKSFASSTENHLHCPHQQLFTPSVKTETEKQITLLM